MSDPRIKGPLSAFAVPVGDELHRPKSPFERAFARASFGAFLLTWCIYTAVTLGHAASEYRLRPAQGAKAGHHLCDARRACP